MASSADADIILKLYDLRREGTMRKARAFVAFDFNPKNADDLLAVQRGTGTEDNAYWRQVISYWEMAATLCLQGALDKDLFIETNGEFFFTYAKFAELYGTATGQPFMPQAAKFIQSSESARSKLESMLKAFAARKG